MIAPGGIPAINPPMSPPKNVSERKVAAPEPGGISSVLDTYLVVGSFRDPSNARRLAARFAAASVTPAQVWGQVFQRVVAGPYAREDLPGARTEARGKGIAAPLDHQFMPGQPDTATAYGRHPLTAAPPATNPGTHMD